MRNMSEPTPTKRATVAGVDKKIDDLTAKLNAMSDSLPTLIANAVKPNNFT